MVYLVGRELCLFLSVDATKVPTKQRDAYVALAVRQAAPYQDPAFDCAWVGDHAAVWYWPLSRVMERVGQQAGPRSRFSAEATHLGGIHDEAVELFALHVGVEGRLWRRRRLVASRWWPQSPTPVEWQAFLRGAGVVGSEEVPSAATITLAERPWSESGRGHSAARLQLTGLDQYLPRFIRGCTLAALLLFSWQIGSAARAAFDARQAQTAATELEDSLARILEARNTADAARVEIDALLQLRAAAPQHLLMAEVARLIEGSSARLRVWQLPHPERLEVTLVAPSPNPEELVSAWEASPLFRDVTAELSRQQGEIVVRATIQGPVRR